MPNSLQRSWLGLMAVCALGAAIGCSPQYYKDSADREVYSILEAKSSAVPGMPEDYAVERPEADPLEGCPTWDLPQLPAPGEQPPAEGAQDAPTQTAVVISLARALAIATTNSRDYQTQKETLYESALSLTSQRYGFGPQFSGTISGDYDHTDLGDSASVSADSDFGLDWLFATGTQLSVTLGTSLSQFVRGSPERAATSAFNATITQPLLQGAGIAVTEPLTQAERDVIYQIRSFVRYRRTFFVSVLASYYRILQQRQILENERLNYENLTFLLERSESLGEAGRLAEFQVDQIRQDELSAENSLVTARQAYQNQLDDFKITLGLPTETSLVLDPQEMTLLTELGVVDIDLPADRIEQIALGTRLDLMTQDDRVEDTRRKVEVAENDLLPGLDLSASLDTDTDDDSNPTDFQMDRTDLTVGFELDLPLDKLSERNEYRRRLIDYAKEQRDYEELRDEVRQQVRDAWRQYARAKRSYEIQKASSELAGRRVESTLLLLEAGRADARDVLESRDSLLRAQNAFARALVDYKVASLELARDMGILAVGEEGQLQENFDAYR